MAEPENETTMILAILQARSSSSRFPRKVLQPLLGQAMILRQLERVALSHNIDQLVVATSTDTSDDELSELLRGNGFEVRRGPLDDVVTRFARVIDEFRPEHVVRLTADCPLTDSQVIDEVILEHLSSGCDYTSNVLPPTFPDGLDVEIFSATAFNRLIATKLTAAEREHATMGMYSQPSLFSIRNVFQSIDYSHLRWTVDVPADLDFVEKIYDRLYASGASFGQHEILDLLSREPSLSRTNQDLARNAGFNEEK